MVHGSQEGTTDRIVHPRKFRHNLTVWEQVSVTYGLRDKGGRTC